MRTRKMIFGRIGLFFILLLFTMTFTACANRVSTELLVTETQSEAFSCYTVDQQGKIIYGYEREADGIWYLFIPSAQSVAEVEIHYTGEVTEVSNGELDAKTFTISHAFAENGDQIDLEIADGMDYTVTVLQSNLPSVQIYLKDTTLDTIHSDKDVKYRGNTLVLTEPDGTYDLKVENGVEIKGRGNTTWTLYDKKGYQVKFDHKASVLGMGKASKWVLLANASDDSMLRNQLIYRMAENLDMEFVPDFEYVDLWIDGEYLGTYLLGEKVEIGSSRLNLMQPDGAVFEHDESFYTEEEFWLYSTIMERHFTLKEIAAEEDAVIIIAMADFEAAVDALASYLYTTPSKDVTLEELSTMIDVDSFAQYYLINEYALNRESFATSFYWYKDGAKDVLHLGPVWDFDTCMGNDGAAYTENYGEQHVMFRYLLAAPAFRERTEALYAQYRDKLAAMTANVDILRAEIQDSAKMNYLRWDVLGQATVKKDAVDFYNSFEEAVDAVENWLAGRESSFSIPDCKVVTSQVSEDCRSMEIYFEDDSDYTNVLFAVWNAETDSESAKWYVAQQTEGVWHSTVDLTEFNLAGMYRISVHADEETLAIANGRNYVENAVASDYKLNIQLSEERNIMAITLQDNIPCTNVYFAVWSDQDGQDDIQWFAAERNSDGLWTYNVDMTMYQVIGDYHVHAYEMEDTPPTLLDATTIKVADAAE